MLLRNGFNGCKHFQRMLSTRPDGLNSLLRLQADAGAEGHRQQVSGLPDQAFASLIALSSNMINTSLLDLSLAAHRFVNAVQVSRRRTWHACAAIDIYACMWC